MIASLQPIEIWFATGSQHLYGAEVLERVAQHSQSIVAALNASDNVPLRVVWKPVVKTPDEIRALCLEATAAVRRRDRVDAHVFARQNVDRRPARC